MTMTGTIGRSIDLLKNTWQVLTMDKELLLFPVVSGIATIVAIAVIGLGWIASGGFDRLDGDGFGIVDLVILFIFYLVTYSIVIFFNSALVGAANIRLEGGDPTSLEGLPLIALTGLLTRAGLSILKN